MSNHYETLNVTRDAEDVVIESAYRALMKRHHPDKTNGDPIAAERAKEINAAYSTLRDAETRARYDRSLADDEPWFDAGASAPSAPAAPPPSNVSKHTAVPASGGLTSLMFIGLAVLMGVGSIGSLMNVAATSNTSPSVDAYASDGSNALETAAGSSAADAPSTRPMRDADPLEANQPNDGAVEDEGSRDSAISGNTTTTKSLSDATPADVGQSDVAARQRPKDDLDGLF